MNISEHNSVKLYINHTVAESGNQWIEIVPVDKDGNQLGEITFFGSQEIIFGEPKEG